MSTQKTGYVTCFFLIAILYSSAILINEIALNNPSVYFGKDDGLVFKIIATCILSSLLYTVLKKQLSGFTLINIMPGFGIGLLSYIITYFIDLAVSFIRFNDNSGVFFPLLLGQLLASIIIFIFLFRLAKRF